MAPAVIFLHGFTLTGASWDAVAGALGERYRSLAPDLRGHGSASHAQPVTLAAVLDDLTALVDGLPAQEQPPTVVGYSQGGRIALHLALALGPRVGRLVVIGASPGLADADTRRARRAADARLADEIETMSIERFAERWARTPVLAGQPPAVLAAAHAERLRSTPVGLARALRGLGTGALPSLWDRLGEIVNPVTIIVGERDAKFRALAAEIAPRLRSGQVIVVAGAGHAVALEQPGRVAAIIAGSGS
jgi:2-succinyl-6-hydroxy-2,4-cyclohexadiene-1-carboxylate synthase